MDLLFALPVFALVIFGFVFAVFFVVWPIVLLIQCVFDKRIGLIYKAITVLMSFVSYPLPSFVYGAFIRKGFMSILALALFGLAWLAFIGMIIFAGGAFLSFIFGAEDNMERYITKAKSQNTTQTESVYKGYNTYDPQDVNVFEDGRGARNDEPSKK